MGRWLHTLVARLLGKFGLELIPSWRMVRLPLARHLRDVFDECDIRCVLDVGANTGQYRDFLRREVGYRGQIISFEPISGEFERLRKRAADDSRWHVMNLALGDHDYSAELHVMASSDLSSLHMPKAKGPQYRMNVVQRNETVSVRRLDKVVEELGSIVPTGGVYLKTDTQGHDLAVIEGASGILERVVALQSEMAVVRVYDNAPSYTDAIAALETKGYLLSGMFPAAVGGGLRLFEFDCVMIRRGLERGNA
jgi:FkbM family methyltransferase